MNVVARPSRESALLAVAPGIVAAIALAAWPPAFAAGLLGLVIVAAATLRGSRFGVTIGSAVAFLGVLAAGVRGGEPALVLLATAGTIVTWTTAQHVVGLGRQLGRDAGVQRSVVVHLAGATLATVAAGGLALAVYLSTGGGLPLGAVVFLLAGATILIYALEP